MDELSDCLHFALALTENQAKRRANTPNAVRANRISVSAGVNSDWRQTHPFMAGLYLVMGGLRRRRSRGGPLARPVLLSTANSGQCRAVAHQDRFAILMSANSFLPWPGSHKLRKNKLRKNLEETL
jgi:hypothetical protein